MKVDCLMIIDIFNLIGWDKVSLFFFMFSPVQAVAINVQDGILILLLLFKGCPFFVLDFSKTETHIYPLKK
jgi:hypothetical protein